MIPPGHIRCVKCGHVAIRREFIPRCGDKTVMETQCRACRKNRLMLASKAELDKLFALGRYPASLRPTVDAKRKAREGRLLRAERLAAARTAWAPIKASVDRVAPCLTLWLSNTMDGAADNAWGEEVRMLMTEARVQIELNINEWIMPETGARFWYDADQNVRARFIFLLASYDPRWGPAPVGIAS